MAILDTDLIISYFRKVPDAISMINKLKENKTVLKTTVITVGELYKGAYLSTKVEENKQKIKEFLRNVKILNLKTRDITEYARISVTLSKKGEMIGYFDELIGSMTLARNETLITRNVRHYEKIPNLSFINWEKIV